jgi:hypothetical protein
MSIFAIVSPAEKTAILLNHGYIIANGRTAVKIF